MDSRLVSAPLTLEEIESLIRPIYAWWLCAKEDELNSIIHGVYRANQTAGEYFLSLFIGNKFPTLSAMHEGYVQLKIKVEFLTDLLTGPNANDLALKFLETVCREAYVSFPPTLCSILKDKLIEHLEKAIPILDREIEKEANEKVQDPELTKSMLTEADKVGEQAKAQAKTDYLTQEKLRRQQKVRFEEDKKMLATTTKIVQKELARQMDADSNNKKRAVEENNEKNKITDTEIPQGFVRARSKEWEKMPNQSKIFNTQPQDVPEHEESFKEATESIAKHFHASVVKGK